MSYEISIEISKGSSIKYEFENDKLTVDRFLNVPFLYPFNYGYVPYTMGRDNDPLDAVVICDQSLMPCCSIKCKLIGALKTNDESGEDNKFIFVPEEKIDLKSKKINSLKDIPSKDLDNIKYFFTHYKDLDKNKWINVDGFIDSDNVNSLFLYSNTFSDKTRDDANLSISKS